MYALTDNDSPSHEQIVALADVVSMLPFLFPFMGLAEAAALGAAFEAAILSAESHAADLVGVNFAWDSTGSGI